MEIKEKECKPCRLILPVDLSAKALPRQRFLLLDQLRTTLASVLHTSILRKNLQKIEWRHCGRSRSDAQVSDGITKYSERIPKLKEPCAVNLSVLKSVMKCSKTRVPQKSVRVPYIPEHFLSPDGYTSGHVARIQLYTCHHLEPPPLERHLYSSSYPTKLLMQGVTWCTTFLGARSLLSGEYGVSPCTPSLWSRLPLSRSASLAHHAFSGKLFPCLDLWLGNDHLITSSFVLVPLESFKQAFLISRRRDLSAVSCHLIS